MMRSGFEAKRPGDAETLPLAAGELVGEKPLLLGPEPHRG